MPRLSRLPRRRAMVVAVVLGIAVPTAVIGAALIGRPSPLGSQPATVDLRIASRVLGRDMAVGVWSPTGDRAEPRSIVYLFPGRGGDARTWFAGSNGDGVGAAGVAAGLIDRGAIPSAILVSVDIDDSYGVDSSPADDGYDHGPYGTWLADELFPAVERQLGVAIDPRRRFVAGFSMGAFAALHLAFRHPDAVAGVGALSPAAWTVIPADRRWQYGSDAGSHDPLALARSVPLQSVRVFLAAGSTDLVWIRDATSALNRTMADRAVPHRTMEVPGGHDVSTWRAAAEPMLTWLLAETNP